MIQRNCVFAYQAVGKVSVSIRGAKKMDSIRKKNIAESRYPSALCAE
jgi:hypothetical protein